MKIALVSSSSGSHGGGEFYLRELASGLRDSGHQPIAWLSTHSQMDSLADSFRHKDLPVRRFHYVNTYHRKLRSLGAAMDIRLQKQMASEFENSGADVIHLNQQCLEDGLDLLLAASRCSLPTVSTIHVTRTAVSLKARAAVVRDALCRRVLRRTTIPLIGISHTSARDLCKFVNGHDHLSKIDGNGSREKGGVAVYSVANGVADPVLNPRDELRDSLHLQDSDIVIGVIARIEQQKNPLFMCRLLEHLPNVHCVWIGDGRMRTALEEEIHRCQQSDRFHLLGWQADASAWLSSFDMFALGSLYEGLPLALLEAMAAGLPCLASAVDGTQDCLTNEQDGFLCPVNDVDAWLEAIRCLAMSPEYRNEIGHAARQRHRDEFSLEAMTERTVAVYEDVRRRG
jgi:glycosyltransferase involved in cell wall biosynthesis